MILVTSGVLAAVPIDPLALLAKRSPVSLIASATGGAELHTNEGNVTGTVAAGVARFGNIPYARPPQRWTPPEPPSAYPGGTRNGTEFGSYCVQTDGSGAEDCLLLNVFTPAAALGRPSAALPVLLWVHGGAYQDGKSNDYDGTNLVSFLNGRLALVTINYRLNVHGFLGSESLRHLDAASGSTGNYGIQDQRAAFEWVQKNARFFGGDPARVTIFGESAGGGSMTMHLAMPKSRGLFAQTIIESGSFGSWVARPLEHAESIYAQVLTASACADAACLATRSKANLSRVIHSIPARLCCGQVSGGNGTIPWAPTIDSVELWEHPYALALKKNITHVPIMHGTNLDEGATFEPLQKQVNATELLRAWQSWYGGTMGAHAAAELSPLYLAQHYPVPGVGSTAWWAAQRSLTDQIFACSARMLSHRLGDDVPIYHYLFTPATLPTRYHGAEVSYVFLHNSLSPADRALAETIADAWAAFAESGAPSRTWARFDPAADGPFVMLDVAPSAGGGGIRNASGLYRASCGQFFDAWNSVVSGAARSV